MRTSFKNNIDQIANLSAGIAMKIKIETYLVIQYNKALLAQIEIKYKT